MTVAEIKKRLKKSGWTFSEGANHTLALSPDKSIKIPIPRHKGDLKIKTLKSIEKGTGVNLS